MAQLEAAVAASARRRQESSAIRVEGSIDGIYVQFESFPGYELALTSLEPQRGPIHPELRAVTSHEVDGESIQRATVFVPDGWIGHFTERLEQYVTENTKTDKPKHRNLVERISQLRLATLEALWTDSPDAFPDDRTKAVWWELWLRRRTGDEYRFAQFAEVADIEVAGKRLVFEDRIVALVRTSALQLGAALDLLDDIAELRRPVEAAQFLADLPGADQAEFVNELAERLAKPLPDAPATCLLDTGVATGHPLLRAAISPNDAYTVNPNWGSDDRTGHGTEMAGLAAYGDLAAALLSQNTVQLDGPLESVKILPNRGQNQPDTYGAITAQAASLVEIQHPKRSRAFMLAVTATATDSNDLGQPSAWSSAVDALSAGRAIMTSDKGLVYLDEPQRDAQRLFIISTGNIRRPYDRNHLDHSDNSLVEEPAQAWNALTVGAFTTLGHIQRGVFRKWQPLAASGELSPFSRTSVGFRDQWPYKPEVVFEGGNAAVSPNGTAIDTPPDLQLLTTSSPACTGRLLTTAAGTSSAAAQAAYFGRRLAGAYPHLWPETIRGLIVHSARWTQAMAAHFPGASRQAKVALVRRYGWGVPELLRALRSADDSVTLIAQKRIHPYKDGKMREMHLHDLPWPTDELAALGDAQVQMRIVLSYFVEPNAARRGWSHRFRYASHGLRFDARRPTESRDEFRKRINKLARAEGERRPTADSDADQWLLGPLRRVRGSLHVDHWTGPAVELAARGAIAVYPVTGWWKERKTRDRSDEGVRYALIVSIEAPELDVDLWTPVAIAAEAPVVIETQRPRSH